MTDKRSENGKGKGVEATGGDKGSKKTNDFEVSGREIHADAGSHNPENFGREGVDNEKVSRKGDREKIADEPGAVADPGRKPRKTTKGERGSRKPGTELTKEERTAQAH